MSTTSVNKKTATQAAAHAEQGTGQNALVFGANGISGIATITKLLEKPESEWAKVIAVSRRPPQLDFKDPRLIFVSIDLLSTPIPEIAKRLLDNGASEAHHAFFYAYIEKATDEETTDVNTELLKRSAQAVENACPDLKSFTLQTGMKVSLQKKTIAFVSDKGTRLYAVALWLSHWARPNGVYALQGGWTTPCQELHVLLSPRGSAHTCVSANDSLILI